MSATTRYWAGALALALDLCAFVIVHILIIWRREYQPLKVHNWMLCLLTIYHKIFIIIWVALREMGIFSYAPCRAMTWVICGALSLYLAPPTLRAWRAIWIAQLEQRKIEAGGAVENSVWRNCLNLQCFACCRTNINWRVAALAVIVFGMPVFVVPPVVNRVHTYFSDFDFQPCTNYDTSMMIPFIMSCIWIMIVGLYAAIRLRSMNDAWGLGRNLLLCLIYNFFLVTVGFVVVNLGFEEFNTRYFESGWICWAASFIGTIHLVIWPALQTFWMPQSWERPRSVSYTSTPPEEKSVAAPTEARPPTRKQTLATEKKERIDLLTIILKKPEYYAKFLNYCTREFNSENPLFWDDVQSFKYLTQGLASGPEALISRIITIRDKYLMPDSLCQINLPSHVQSDQMEYITKAIMELKQPPSHAISIPSTTSSPVSLHAPALQPAPFARFVSLYDPAQKEVMRLMSADTFPRFCKCEAEWIRSIHLESIKF